jgi:predicted O-linked N-acetylglucosamine transferase (SPINDLY family)
MANAEELETLQKAANLKAAGFHRNAVDLCQNLVRDNPDFFEAHAIKMEALQYAEDGTVDEIFDSLRFWTALNPPHNTEPAEPVISASPRDKLRVGYMALDFRANPATLGTLPALHFHNREQFHISGYADLSRPDGATEQFLQRCDSHRNFSGVSSTDAARMIREDEIDILIILAAHTARWLTAIARHRPAPVQISWHNNCSVGIPEVDYFIGDSISTPRDGTEPFLERVIHMPCWTIQAFPHEMPDITAPPVQVNNYVTFGSFNNPIKITTRVISLWSRVLQQVPNSWLLLKFYDIYTNTALTERIAKGFTDHGIAADRIQFLDSTENRGQHLAQYNRIDIALDPFPFSGATTTFEALLMGVPVISLLGDRFVARMSSSLLHSVGLQAFSAASEEAYIVRATELAGNVDFLARIRGALRPILQASRLHDSRRFTRNLERVYRAAWRIRQTKMAQPSQ